MQLKKTVPICHPDSYWERETKNKLKQPNIYQYTPNLYQLQDFK
ncbi:hypothetical protein [Flavobacterium sp.]|nr:hypothetical protein [Flavobacterium sp.]